jgi:hypothetical protein
MPEITPQAFQEQISSRMAGAPVSPEQALLFTDVSTVAIRRAGGYITECVLSGEPVLYRTPPSELSVADIPASHLMHPVGVHDEHGGNQGAARWLDYRRDARTDHYIREFITMEAFTPQGGPRITRHLRLNHIGFTISSVIDNTKGGRFLDTSIGERLYLDHADEDPEGLRINSMTPDLLFGQGALDRIMSGQAEFWPGAFREGIQVGFSTGKQIQITPILIETPTRRGIGIPELGGAFVWHHPGTDSICIEPTFGVTYGEITDTLKYDSLPVPVGSTAIMTTRLALMSEQG